MIYPNKSQISKKDRNSNSFQTSVTPRLAPLASQIKPLWHLDRLLQLFLTISIDRLRWGENLTLCSKFNKSKSFRVPARVEIFNRIRLIISPNGAAVEPSRALGIYLQAERLVTIISVEINRIMLFPV